MLVGDETDGIDVEAEVCRMMSFDPATYALVEGLATDSTDNESEKADSEHHSNTSTIMGSGAASYKRRPQR